MYIYKPTDGGVRFARDDNILRVLIPPAVRMHSRIMHRRDVFSLAYHGDPGKYIYANWLACVCALLKTA